MDNNDMMNTLNNMINSGQIPDNIKEMLNNLASDSNSNSQNSNSQKENKEKDDSSSSSMNPEMLANMLHMFGQNNSNTNQSNSSNNTIDMEMLLKMKTIMEKMNSNKEDPRANLLLSLKPYLKESRKEKVDQYAKLFKMSKVMELFNSTGGENKK